MANDPRDPDGLAQYQGAIEAINENFPGLLPTLREAYDRRRTANEVPQSAVLTEMPREEDVVRDIIKKYDLVPRRTLNRRTMGVQVKLQGVDKETQTERPIPRTTIVREDRAATNPFLALLESQTPPLTPDSVTDSAFSIPVRQTTARAGSSEAPYRNTGAKRASRWDTPTEEEIRGTKRPTSRLIPTNPRGCWNCGGDHRYSRCTRNLKIFCFRCGEPGYTSDRCPHCNEE